MFPDSKASYLPFPWNSHRELERARSRCADDLATPRCPVCFHFLVVRQGRKGPYFFCRCVHGRPPRSPRAA